MIIDDGLDSEDLADEAADEINAKDLDDDEDEPPDELDFEGILKEQYGGMAEEAANDPELESESDLP
jgi:hypothetical protein